MPYPQTFSQELRDISSELKKLRSFLSHSEAKSSPQIEEFLKLNYRQVAHLLNCLERNGEATIYSKRGILSAKLRP